MLLIAKIAIWCNWQSDLCPNVIKSTRLRLLTGQLCLIPEAFNSIIHYKSYVLT